MRVSSLVAAAAGWASAVHATRVWDHLAEMKVLHDVRHLDRAQGLADTAPKLGRRQARFLTEKTQPFVVDGTKIPEVPFDVGESYAGLLPISDDPDEESKLYFWFNGGPGCSSLSGLLTENGPFTWEAGTLAPVQNPYSWHNLTNMIWVEQGTPKIRNERQLARQFMGFFKNFIDTFDMHGAKVYLTGESYAGFYVPYIANAFLNASDETYFNLKGVAINDPIIAGDTLQQAVPIVPYVDYWSKLFNLNSSFIERIHAANDKCGYTDYYNKYLTFPPPAEKFPDLPIYYQNPGCDVLDSVYAAVLEINPCFNIYHITDYCPFKNGVLGIVNPGDYVAPGAQNYFNRTDVQAAINAPVGTNWMQCTDINVFGGPNNSQSRSDRSPGPAVNNVLKKVIEGTNNTLIGVGDLDFLLPTNGTLLAIQNITWHGVKGFQKPPTSDFYVPYHPDFNPGALGEAGIVGKWATERGLTFYSVALAGHELPGYTPGAGYRILEVLLGRVPNLGTVSSFTTQKGNFTGTTDLY